MPLVANRQACWFSVMLCMDLIRLIMEGGKPNEPMAEPSLSRSKSSSRFTSRPAALLSRSYAMKSKTGSVRRSLSRTFAHLKGSELFIGTFEALWRELVNVCTRWGAPMRCARIFNSLVTVVMLASRVKSLSPSMSTTSGWEKTCSKRSTMSFIRPKKAAVRGFLYSVTAYSAMTPAMAPLTKFTGSDSMSNFLMTLSRTLLVAFRNVLLAWPVMSWVGLILLHVWLLCSRTLDW
mmetsp:Transcript_42752/g.96494  ORF Transcript_42752/g.96494 Transcript_42752/m.96494 type:complete len:235 (+) Transcript_42752:1063-1767(+)